MTYEIEVALRASIIGIGGTVAMDAWAAMLQYLVRTPATNWAMVGRWLGHMPKGEFQHENMRAVAPIRGEVLIGWMFHYGIGIAYGLLLVAVTGRGWLAEPTAFPAVLMSLVLLVAPYLVMMPGLGLGIAGSKTPKPNVTRLKSVLAHTMFGLGMYATALLIST